MFYAVVNAQAKAGRFRKAGKARNKIRGRSIILMELSVHTGENDLMLTNNLRRKMLLH